MTPVFTLAQLEQVHALVHAEAVDYEPAADGGALEKTHTQRVAVMDDLMMRMFIYDKKTLDAEELEPGVEKLISHLLEKASA